jgi:hypothetical protein
MTPRDDEELEENPYGNPAMRGGDALTREAQSPKRAKPDEEAGSGFGALWYVVAIVGAVVVALRFFLKQK